MGSIPRVGITYIPRISKGALGERAYAALI